MSSDQPTWSPYTGNIPADVITSFDLFNAKSDGTFDERNDDFSKTISEMVNGFAWEKERENFMNEPINIALPRIADAANDMDAEENCKRLCDLIAKRKKEKCDILRKRVQIWLNDVKGCPSKIEVGPARRACRPRGPVIAAPAAAGSGTAQNNTGGGAGNGTMNTT